MHQIRWFDRKIVEWTERHTLAAEILRYLSIILFGVLLGAVAFNWILPYMI